MKTFTINNVPIDAEWKKIKNIRLSVRSPDGMAHVSAPAWVGEDAIRDFLITKLDWIKKKSTQILSRPRTAKKEFISGENHYYKGQPYILRIIYHNKPPKVEMSECKYINLYIKQTASIPKRAQVLQEWYRQELKNILQPLITKWESLISVKANCWEVKRMKTLWGSCHIRKRKLLFNLELMKKSFQCIEYVVVHELTHLLERRHNAHFKSLLDKTFPNWRQTKKELNERFI